MENDATANIYTQSTAELDNQLDKFLDKHLTEATKHEIASEAALTRLEEAIRDGKPIGDDEAATTDLDFKASADYGTSNSATHPAKRLAAVTFSDGGCFEFRGNTGDGTLLSLYSGPNSSRDNALAASIASPLRLFCSLTAPDTPVPWLIAAVDKTPDRAWLMRGRTFCDASSDPLPVPDDALNLQIPGAPGGSVGFPVPGSLAGSDFCGAIGKELFEQACEDAETANDSGVYPNIYRCTPNLIWGINHTSGGKRRKTATGIVAICGAESGVDIKILRSAWFGGQQVVEDVTVTPQMGAPLQRVTASAVARRKWKIIFAKHDFTEPGGFRAWSMYGRGAGFLPIGD